MKVFVQKSKYSTNLYFGQITKLILINLVNREHVKFDILPPCAAGVCLLGNCVCNFDYFLFKYLKIVLVRFISSVIVRNCDNLFCSRQLYEHETLEELFCRILGSRLWSCI